MLKEKTNNVITQTAGLQKKESKGLYKGKETPTGPG